MNRSILIVICDFLLVSLLAFSTVDINKVSDNASARSISTEIATNQVDSGKDLAAVMRLALDEERKNRDQLVGELTRTRGSVNERERQVQTFQQQLQARQEETLRLQQQQTNLQRQFAAAQTNLLALNQQLQATTTESKERLAAMEAEAKKREGEARKQAAEAAAFRQQIDQLGKSNQVVLAEKQRLSTQLQVAEGEKRSATEQAVRMQEQVKVEREEKAKLAEGVKALASKSGELTQEIRENRPLAPNTIFNDFVTNRVKADFSAVRAGVFGDATKRKETETVLATDGTRIFALCHVQDTPLTLWNPGTEWQSLGGTLGRGTASFPIRSLSFHANDPRIVLMPITATEARALGGKVYRISPDPFKFQDAVLVGAREGYYGESKFQIDLSTPNYVKMDRNSFKGLFGKFNPSRGDLVFSKTGELLGIMANGTYCLVMQNFNAGATFLFGNDVRDQHTGQILTLLYSRIFEMPFKLQ
jgi:predicted nuclease with TOPRIM domain